MVSSPQSMNERENKSENSAFQNYIVGKTIGQGAYAVVKIAVHKPSGKKVAIKVVNE